MADTNNKAPSYSAWKSLSKWPSFSIWSCGRDGKAVFKVPSKPLPFMNFRVCLPMKNILMLSGHKPLEAPATPSLVGDR